MLCATLMERRPECGHDAIDGITYTVILSIEGTY